MIVAQHDGCKRFGEVMVSSAVGTLRLVASCVPFGGRNCPRVLLWLPTGIISWGRSELISASFLIPFFTFHETLFVMEKLCYVLHPALLYLPNNRGLMSLSSLSNRLECELMLTPRGFREEGHTNVGGF